MKTTLGQFILGCLLAAIISACASKPTAIENQPLPSHTCDLCEVHLLTWNAIRDSDFDAARDELEATLQNVSPEDPHRARLQATLQLARALSALNQGHGAVARDLLDGIQDPVVAARLRHALGVHNNASN